MDSDHINSITTAPGAQAAATLVHPANKAAVVDVPAPAATPAQLSDSVAAINRFLQPNSNVEFSIDHDSGKPLIKVIDSETHAVLRQLPSAAVLAIAKDLSKLHGLLIEDLA